MGAGGIKKGNEMTGKLSIIAFWAGIVGAASAIYFPIHSELIAERQAQAAEKGV
jgi:hypothetical protein